MDQTFPQHGGPAPYLLNLLVEDYLIDHYGIQPLSTYSLVVWHNLPHTVVKFDTNVRVAIIHESPPDEIVTSGATHRPHCDVYQHDICQLPVGEHSVFLLMQPLLQHVSSTEPPHFDKDEDVHLCPFTLIAMCQDFGTTPEIDLFPVQVTTNSLGTTV